MPILVGSAVRFKDNGALRGVVFEFQDDGAVAGLNCLSKKLADSGCGETTHEPVENLEEVEDVWRIGSKVFLQSDGPEFYGEIFEYQDDMAVAGLKNLSEKLNNLGCGEQTHEPVENLKLLS
mmetsp:Transcript_32318/g.96239  ORF Transcript_32318/g.96239 Transcript_32318/m.96239 type:complete len:122 (-) Transcript_32318:412-777(-)